jgi:hypothetical protein
MSRSTYMLMALAPPAAKVPPMTVFTISQQRGHALLGDHHRGDRGDEEELDDARLGERDVAGDARTQGVGGRLQHGSTLGSPPCQVEVHTT